MTKELKQKAKDFIENKICDTDSYSCGYLPSTVEEMLIEFATEITKELQEENKRLIKIEEDYYDFLQKKNEEDWKGDNVVGCLNLRIEQKDKQLTKAKELLEKYLSIGVGGKITQNYLDVTKEAEQFIKDSEVEK